MGVNGGASSGGESSCDERARRRRLLRSASDPDCTTTTSGSELDTVIFLGVRPSACRASDSESQDAQTVVSQQRRVVSPTSSSTRLRPPSMGVIRENLPVMAPPQPQLFQEARATVASPADSRFLLVEYNFLEI